MLIIFFVCNAIPLVGILKTLKKMGVQLPWILARSSKWFFCFFDKKLA
jgi:hypothetical protein